MHKSRTLQPHAFVKHQSPLILGSQATYPQMYLLHPSYQVCPRGELYGLRRPKYPIIHFTSASQSGSCGRKCVLYGTNVQICTPEVHKTVPVCCANISSCSNRNKALGGCRPPPSRSFPPLIVSHNAK